MGRWGDLQMRRSWASSERAAAPEAAARVARTVNFILLLVRVWGEWQVGCQVLDIQIFGEPMNGWPVSLNNSVGKLRKS